MSRKLMLPFAAALAGWACQPGNQQATADTGPPECPHSVQELFPRVTLPQGADIPERNDCQRFLVERTGQLQFDGLFGIYAGELGTLGPQLDRLRQSQPNSSWAVMGAEIIAFDRAYDPLKIVFDDARPDNTTFTCLFLWDEEDSGTWHAIMVPRDVLLERLGRQCLEPLENPEQWENQYGISVHPADLPGFSGKHVPPVARWDWDEPNKKQYIGIKCRDKWCEIGDDDFAPSPPPHDCVGPPDDCAPMRVKGWYDEQTLAIERNGRMVPTGIVGTIFPTPGLGSFPPPIFDNKWARVASVLLNSTNGATSEEWEKYRDMYGLRPPERGKRFNSLWLCHGNNCGVTPAETLNPTNCSGNTEWWARIVSTRDEVTYLCVTWRGANLPVPGTTRWRWRTSDDGWWARCLQGCCSDE